MDITAEFSPSVDKPENNTFTNTTPQSGYCLSYSKECAAKGLFSLAMGITLTPSKALTANDQPQDSLYFKMPSTPRKITVQNNQTGETQEISFRVSAFSGMYWGINDHGAYDWKNVSFFSYPTGGCNYVTPGWLSNKWFRWIWDYPTGDIACYNLSKVDRPEGSDKYVRLVEDLSFGYQLTTPNPLKMSSGTYTGSISFSVGPGGEIDFGNNFQATDSELTLNFTLTVNHELKLSTEAQDQNVSLQPCARGRVCSEEEGKANWERWMISLITPQMSGRSNFKLSSSGAFTAYIECTETVGDQCAITSDNSPSQHIPVQTLLTLPDNIVDMDSGATVVKRPLTVGKDLSKNIFVTKEFGQDRSGSIDFLIEQRDVDTMLQTRPDTFKGAVTVFFDPKIY